MILTDETVALQNMLQKLEDVTKEYGMKLNEKRAKSMRVNEEELWKSVRRKKELNSGQVEILRHYNN